MVGWKGGEWDGIEEGGMEGRRVGLNRGWWDGREESGME